MSPEERDNIVKAAEGELSNIIAKHDGLELAHAIDRWQVNYCEKYQDLAHGFRSTASIARQMQSKNPPGAASQIVIGDGNVVQSGNQQLANSQNVDADISVDSRPPQPKASVPWGTIGIFVASFLIAVTWFVPVPRWLPFSLTIAAGVTGLVQWLAFRARTWEKRAYLTFAGIVLFDATVRNLLAGLAVNLVPPEGDPWHASVSLLAQVDSEWMIAAKLVSAAGFAIITFRVKAETST